VGFDVFEGTVRVLEEGLPPLPQRLEPSQTVPVAVWRGESHGAVLFVRLWRNGNMDCECAITERRAGGGWEEPMGSGGGGWIDDPLVRPEEGWQGDAVLWLGESGSNGVRAVRGAASKRVSAIEVEQAGRRRSLPVESPCGAFVVGIESQEPAVVRALDEHGRALIDAAGAPAEIAVSDALP
jgi:hypothetical protein